MGFIYHFPNIMNNEQLIGLALHELRSILGFKCSESLCAMKRPASTGAERLPHCKNKCGRRVQTKRSKLCSNCFGRNAVSSGARSCVVFLNQST